MAFYSIGTYMKLKRKEKKLTQKQLAVMCGEGVSESLISGIEKGTSSPSVRSAVAIAKALQCDINELLGLKVPTHKYLIVDDLTEEQIAALQLLIDGLSK